MERVGRTALPVDCEMDGRGQGRALEALVFATSGIPGVDGLSFQILDRGGSITAPLGVPGLSGSARLQFPGAPSHPDYNVMINLDVLEFLRSR